MHPLFEDPVIKPVLGPKSSGSCSRAKVRSGNALVVTQGDGSNPIMTVFDRSIHQIGGFSEMKSLFASVFLAIAFFTASAVIAAEGMSGMTGVAGMAGSREFNDEGDVDQLVVKSVTMVVALMVVELLPVVGGEDDHRPVVHFKLFQLGDEGTDKGLIGIADLPVVQRVAIFPLERRDLSR